MPYPYHERAALVRAVMHWAIADAYSNDNSPYADANREVAEEELERIALQFVQAVDGYKQRKADERAKP